MHWGISYLHEDLQDFRKEMREFRKEVTGEFASVRKEMATEFTNVRTEMTEGFAAVRTEIADLRKEVAQQLRHNLVIMIGVTGLFATIVIAFIEYRLPGG